MTTRRTKRKHFTRAFYFWQNDVIPGKFYILTICNSGGRRAMKGFWLESTDAMRQSV